MRPVVIFDETHKFRGRRAPDDALVALDASIRALNAGGGRPMYGTSMHYPDCHVNAYGCTGCLPPVIEGEIVAADPGQMYGIIPGRVWDAAEVVDSWAADLLVDDGSEWVVGFDAGRDRDTWAVAFARIRDGAVHVHVPEVR